jgi:phosphoserine phosphatase RsbU/P
MDATPLPGPDQLYDTAPCGLLIARADGTVVDANATLCNWLHCKRSDVAGKLRFQDLLTMGGRIFWQTHLQPLLRMQSSVAEVKLEMRWQDGPVLPVMVNAVERAWNGQVLLHVAVFVAADRHKYEGELLLQRQRAEELAAQHARDQQALAAAQAQAQDRATFAEQLVGVVSHDIRNPLSVIQMSAVLLERGISAEQQKAAIARITRAVRRVQHLIGDLLDFTQARLGGGLSVRKADVDLHQSVADGVAELAAGFPDCVLRHERAGNGRCRADADRIIQAVGNLVANAANHGDRRAPITVRSQGDGALFRVTVHNSGAPIPPGMLPQLFHPMVRGAAPGAGKGVGLGLYIVRAIARAHGGDVTVRSTAEEGTTFGLEWPAA